jgi:multidrug resistance efflux pump
LLGVAVGGTAPGRADDPKPGKAVLEMRGYVVPLRTVQVVPRVAGIVTDLNVEEGQVVKEGDVLARLDAREYEIEVKRAEIQFQVARLRYEEMRKGPRPEEVKQSEAKVRQAEAQLELRKSDLDRARRLLGTNAISKEDYNQREGLARVAEVDLAAAKTVHALLREGPQKEKVEAAKAEVQLAEVDLARAKLRLDGTALRAPISGIVLARRVEKGGFVNPRAFGLTVGGSICDLADLNELEVDVAVAERDLGKVSLKQECEVRPDAFPKLVCKGMVARLAPVADRAKGTVGVRVRIAVPKSDRLLRPEMAVTVRFLAKE